MAKVSNVLCAMTIGFPGPFRMHIANICVAVGVGHG